MNVRKIVGPILIALGLVLYILLFTDYTPAGRAGRPLFFIACFLFTVGSIIFRWDYWKRWKRN